MRLKNVGMINFTRFFSEVIIEMEDIENGFDVILSSPNI